jgi:DNA-binding SARP family transcriptional activator
MPIERLGSRLEAIWDYRLGLVVGPPGSGKTTQLSRFAETVDAPVAWVRCDRWDTTPSACIRQLGRAFGPWTDGTSTAWSDADDLIEGLAEWDPPKALLVIDDLHALDGSEAEAVLERLIDHLPHGLHLLVASRTQPAFNLSRLRLEGALLEVDADDLRLRAWEVERLFRDHYHEPMAPEELARLARWTEGWAAGLQLFHLATRGRPADERRRVLRSLGPRSRLARQYLAQNALDRVPDELREFMVHTSVTSRLSGHLCDRLLDRTGSAHLLDELERRSLFTTRVDEAGGYRYHEVFRSHLQSVLIGEVGEDGARDRFLAAGDLLMEEGRAAEALEAYVRAEAWEVVEEVLEVQGPAIADEPLRWLGIHAREPLGHDPWLALAGARRMRAEGRFGDAAKAYAALAADARNEGAASAARRERAELLAWLHPEPGRRPSAEGSAWLMLREALSGGSAVASGPASSLDDELAIALLGIVAGDLRAAEARLARIEVDGEPEGVVACVTLMARGTLALLRGDVHGIADINGAVGSAEGQGLDWLARMGRALEALSGRVDLLHEAARLEDGARALGDRWGAALCRIARAWGGYVASTRLAELDDRLEPGAAAAAAASELRAMEAPVPAAWMTALHALVAATSDDVDAERIGRSAEAEARMVGAPLPLIVARTALAIGRSDRSAAEALVAEAHERYGWRIPLIERSVPTVRVVATQTPSAMPPPTSEPPAELRLYGAFGLAIAGEAVDIGAIRPRVRMLLYLLALESGSTVHREKIMETLWPGSDPGAAQRSLHVAVATLRRVLEPGATRGGFRLVPRDGEGYRLALPPGAHVDTQRFSEALAAARAADVRREADEVERWCRVALESGAGELLPEAGPEEWIVERREVHRVERVEVSTLLAGTLLEAGDPDGAAQVCTDGLRLDRYHDPLWKLLIQAREAADDKAAATSARANYQRTLAELGLAGGGPA